MTEKREQSRTVDGLLVAVITLPLAAVLAAAFYVPSMIEVPAIGGDVSVFEGLFAVAVFATGYAVHEALHVLPLWLWGDDYSVAVLPREHGESVLYALLFGTVVRIEAPGAPRSHAVVAALAPLAMAVIPVGILAYAFTFPVIDAGTLLILFAWFAVAIPSLRDWKTVIGYRTETGATVEVAG